MNRAEMRRMKREQEKAHTVTYNLTQAQLDAIVQEKIGVKIAETKKDVYEETVNTVLALVLTLPLEVLMDHYWPKSYRERLPGFVDKFWSITDVGKTANWIWISSKKIYGNMAESGWNQRR